MGAGGVVVAALGEGEGDVEGELGAGEVGAGAVVGAGRSPEAADAEPPPEAQAVRPNTSARPSAASGTDLRLTRTPFATCQPVNQHFEHCEHCEQRDSRRLRARYRLPAPDSKRLRAWFSR